MITILVCVDWDEAMQLIQVMDANFMAPDLDCYLLLLNTALPEKTDAALHLVEKMRLENLDEDERVLNVHIKLLAQSGRFEQLHQLLLQPPVPLSSTSFEKLFVALAKYYPATSEPSYYFGLMKERDLVFTPTCYASLITMLCHQDKVKEALEFAMNLLSTEENVTALFFNPIVQSLLQSDKVDVALELVQSLLRENVKEGGVLFEGLLSHFLKHCQMDKAVEWFSLMRKSDYPRSRDVYYHLLTAALEGQNLDGALHLVNAEMKCDGIKADRGLIQLLIQYYVTHKGVAEKDAAKRIYDFIKE